METGAGAMPEVGPAGMTNVCVVPAGMTEREKTWSVPVIARSIMHKFRYLSGEKALAPQCQPGLLGGRQDF